MHYAAMEAWTGSGGAGHPGLAAAVAVSLVLKLVCVARYVPTGVRLSIVQLAAVLADANADLVCQKLSATADARELVAAAVVCHVPSGVAATAFAAMLVDEVNVQGADTEESAADEFPAPAVALLYDADLAGYSTLASSVVGNAQDAVACADDDRGIQNVELAAGRDQNGRELDADQPCVVRDHPQAESPVPCRAIFHE
jgi:hypothetical protein